MRPLFKLIKPDLSEVMLYITAGSALLLFSNMRRLWEYYSQGVSFNDILQTQTYGTVVQDFLLGTEARIDPRFADFTVWMIVGAISITVILFFQHLIEDTTEEVEYTQRIASHAQRSQEWSQYVIKGVLRVAGLILLLIWIRIFFGSVFSGLSQEFFSSISDITNPQSWFIIVKTLALSALGLYTTTICLRLICLRTRVLG